ncbi:hypothetical protein [Sphingopyxis sp.]|uniref:hypothetical protein n=1 Tax=Sphingopyxis sp. TaxID=1908224 RepID=UPI001D992DF7|nr:hypothetical protein [Sphingopyxis sp.]MBW8296178.1 hypothetical protein [Sphingopyxis sp.]
MTDDRKSPLAAVGSTAFKDRQRASAMRRANAIVDWLLAHPKVSRPFVSAEFRRAFPDVTRADVKLALAEVERIASA